MATISINVSKHHGSSIEVNPMLSDDCLAFETTVYLKASYEGAEPHFYAKDMVYFHGNNLALRSMLEKLLAALDAGVKTEEAA